MVRLVGIVLGCIMLFSGCGTRIDLRAHGPSQDTETRTMLFKRRVTDDFGRPKFRGRLKRRPFGKGQKYVAIIYQDDLPALAYFITITGRRGTGEEEYGSHESVNYRKSISGEYSDQDTSRMDFDDYAEEGTNNGEVPPPDEPETMRSVLDEDDEDNDSGGLLDEFIGMVLGGIVGGIADGIFEMASHKEVVYSSEKYSYDELHRLSEIWIYAPYGEAMYLETRVKFYYSGEDNDPYDAEMLQTDSGVLLHGKTISGIGDAYGRAGISIVPKRI